MEPVAHAPLVAWEAFYVIIGSSAAALTGLQFVVIALIADSQRRTTSREIGAFGTPTVVHFGAVLLIAAILSAPWERPASAGLGLALSGAAGIAYVVVVIGRAWRTDYRPDIEDGLFYVLLPLIAYATLFVAGVRLPQQVVPCLFVIGGTAVLLLFIGIRNAWDSVTYVAITRAQQAPPEDRT